MESRLFVYFEELYISRFKGHFLVYLWIKSSLYYSEQKEETEIKQIETVFSDNIAVPLCDFRLLKVFIALLLFIAV